MSAQNTELPGWDCWNGYTKSSTLELEGLREGQHILLQTAATVQLPKTHLVINIEGAQPEVIIAEENGLAVRGGTVKLLGSCSLADWANRKTPEPTGLKYGVIVPGELVIFDAIGIIRSRSWVKGWRAPKLGLED